MNSESARVRFQFRGENDSVRVMGVINLTPDSFYAESRARGVADAVERARQMVEEGAALIDVGAESSRPGSRPVAAAAEIERLLPFIREARRALPVVLSVDTWKAEVAVAALDAGADIINDITGLTGDPEMASAVATRGAPVVLMHMQGSPETMQAKPAYGDVVDDIAACLRRSMQLALDAGAEPENIAIDPGIGFGKTLLHNLEILARLDELRALGAPLVLGVSRKSFIGSVLDLPVEERLEGSLAAAAIGVMKGASIIRAHDVAATVRAVKLAEAIKRHERRNP